MARTVLITGASNGIGRALAIAYAAPGARLILVARHRQRLATVAQICRDKGSTVEVGEIDVRDRERLAAFIDAADAAGAIDLVIANAGLTGGTTPSGGLEPIEDSRALIEVNLTGVLNTVQPLLARFAGRGTGQIAIISSIAGLIALPDSPSYCASKAAVLSYGQALRQLLRRQGVKVNVVCAGFVTTDMSRRVSGWKPGEVTPERAAGIIVRGLSRNRPVIAFPWYLAILARASILTPELVRRPFLRAFRFTVSPPGH